MYYKQQTRAILSWKFLWKVIHHFRQCYKPIFLTLVCFLCVCSWMPRLLCEGQRTMCRSRFSLSIRWVLETELGSPVLATSTFLTCWGWLPIDSFSGNILTSFQRVITWVIAQMVPIKLPRVQYKKKKIWVFWRGVFLLKSIKEMCREIRHFYLLNKWNGQETNYRSSSLRIWAREVRHERWGNDSVDRWPEFRSPEKHPQPQCRQGRRAKTEGSQELTAQRAAELWVQWETRTHRKPQVESGTGRSSSWRGTSTSAHINSFSSSLHSPTKHNKYDLYTLWFLWRNRSTQSTKHRKWCFQNREFREMKLFF